MDDIFAMKNYEAVLRLIDLELEKRGWNQSRLAKEMGMSDSWVSRVLGGDIELSVPMLLKIAETLMVAPASLLPIIELQGMEAAKPMTFEEYCRKIVQEEVEKALSKK